ncbi:LysR family transcriptional regulator [Mesorhizobium sp.]|uniref:LysR family transcriptional regulator n=1 Tax=Mesorhizobium sp. TaxID=1871066 RepID=UPI00345BEF30
MRGTEFSELNAFAAIVEEGSFVRAAARLRVSPSALSQTIRGLEERVGVRLLNRTTRSVSPTATGETLFARLAPAFSARRGCRRRACFTRSTGRLAAHQCSTHCRDAFHRAHPRRFPPHLSRYCPHHNHR